MEALTRKEREKELRKRHHRDSYHEESGSTQDKVTRHTSHFDDKFQYKIKN